MNFTKIILIIFSLPILHIFAPSGTESEEVLPTTLGQRKSARIAKNTTKPAVLPKLSPTSLTEPGVFYVRIVYQKPENLAHFSRIPVPRFQVELHPNVQMFNKKKKWLKAKTEHYDVAKFELPGHWAEKFGDKIQMSFIVSSLKENGEVDVAMPELMIPFGSYIHQWNRHLILNYENRQELVPGVPRLRALLPSGRFRFTFHLAPGEELKHLKCGTIKRHFEVVKEPKDLYILAINGEENVFEAHLTGAACPGDKYMFSVKKLTHISLYFGTICEEAMFHGNKMHDGMNLFEYKIRRSADGKFVCELVGKAPLEEEGNSPNVIAPPDDEVENAEKKQHNDAFIDSLFESPASSPTNEGADLVDKGESSSKRRRKELNEEQIGGHGWLRK